MKFATILASAILLSTQAMKVRQMNKEGVSSQSLITSDVSEVLKNYENL